MILQIITTIIGAIGMPLLIYLYYEYFIDRLEPETPSSKSKKFIGLFLMSIPGGMVGWAIGKGFDYLWKLIFG
jgi:hypothetical protein